MKIQRIKRPQDKWRKHAVTLFSLTVVGLMFVAMKAARLDEIAAVFAGLMAAIFLARAVLTEAGIRRVT